MSLKSNFLAAVAIAAGLSIAPAAIALPSAEIMNGTEIAQSSTGTMEVRARILTMMEGGDSLRVVTDSGETRLVTVSGELPSGSLQPGDEVILVMAGDRVVDILDPNSRESMMDMMAAERTEIPAEVLSQMEGGNTLRVSTPDGVRLVTLSGQLPSGSAQPGDDIILVMVGDRVVDILDPNSRESMMDMMAAERTEIPAEVLSQMEGGNTLRVSTPDGVRLVTLSGQLPSGSAQPGDDIILVMAGDRVVDILDPDTRESMMMTDTMEPTSTETNVESSQTTVTTTQTTVTAPAPAAPAPAPRPVTQQPQPTTRPAAAPTPAAQPASEPIRGLW
ncbi:MAG: hypothetical protein HC881_14880 [Leptolyngbyaceae cyanobacterium SL_7_1]|nr:hypothetical protein [Leptolyngbyaceae cyanobacterium SL_7_1]